MMAIEIGKRREFIWDNYLVDERKTTADRRVHEPIRREVSITLDKPWEGDGCDFFCTVYDDIRRVYRMYYNGWEMMSPDRKTHVAQHFDICCLESEDGIHWERPNLGLVEFDGSKDNNIIIVASMYPGLTGLDNFFVMADTNPNPAVPGRFKAVMAYREKMADGSHESKLMALVSDDGYTFRLAGVVTKQGKFDSLNTVIWHEASHQYICYIRDFHEAGTWKDYESGDLNSLVRDIRVLFSSDFIHWTNPQHLKFNDVEDFPLYTNCVSAYPGAEHILVGFPSRYVEKKEWTANFDHLCGAEKRRERCQSHPRYGQAVTDCLFMCSRDGIHWYRYDEAFMRPGPEFPANWVYGSCFPSVGLIPTPSAVPGADDEWSFYIYDNHWLSIPAEMVRVSMRKDGFVSLHADREPKKIVTKSFTFEGSELKINFSTSARGWLYLKVCADDGSAILSSCELFGDRINRIVDLDGNLSALAGKSVHLEIELKDADFYAFQFQ